MTTNESLSLNESIVIFNYKPPCVNNKHIWSTHFVITTKEGEVWKTEMKKCIKCEIIRDMRPKKEEIVDTY